MVTIIRIVKHTIPSARISSPVIDQVALDWWLHRNFADIILLPHLSMIGWLPSRRLHLLSASILPTLRLVHIGHMNFNEERLKIDTHADRGTLENIVQITEGIDHFQVVATLHRILELIRLLDDQSYAKTCSLLVKSLWRIGSNVPTCPMEFVHRKLLDRLIDRHGTHTSFFMRDLSRSAVHGNAGNAYTFSYCVACSTVPEHAWLPWP